MDISLFTLNTNSDFKLMDFAETNYERKFTECHGQPYVHFNFRAGSIFPVPVCTVPLPVCTVPHGHCGNKA